MKRGFIAMDISSNFQKTEIWMEFGIVGFTMMSMVK